MGIKITGTGSRMPSRVVTNAELSGLVDTSDEWIKERTGIRERRVCAGEALADIAAEAAEAAISDAGVNSGDLDYIICSTVRHDYITPSLACMVQKRIGGAAVCFDINAACTGFIYAADVAAALIAAGKAKKILIVCAEMLSHITDWTDRKTCVLFADGAGAAVIEEGDALKAIKLTSSGNDEFIRASAPAGNSPFSTRETEPPYLFMNGQEIYKFAVTAIERDVREAMSMGGITADEVDFFLLHQANKRIIEAARLKLAQPEEKFPTNIKTCGNTSSACIPILLDELSRSGRLRRGGTLIMSAFGAGLTTGVCAIKWTK